MEKAIYFKIFRKFKTDEILSANKVFYTSPAEKMTRISSDIHTLATRIDMVKTMHLVFKYNQKEIYASHSYEGIKFNYC